MLKRIAISGSALLVLLLLLVGCGPAATTPTATPTSMPAATATVRAACGPLATAQQLLTSLAAVGTNTTVGDVQSMQQKLQGAIDAVNTRVPGTPGPAMSQLQSISTQVAQAVQGMPADQTLGEASTQLATIKEKAATGLAATTRVSVALGCTP
jgi:hypothetical protein